MAFFTSPVKIVVCFFFKFCFVFLSPSQPSCVFLFHGSWDVPLLHKMLAQTCSGKYTHIHFFMK